MCYEIFELKFSKIRRTVISNNFSKKCFAIEIFEFLIKVARALEGTSFYVLLMAVTSNYLILYIGTGFIFKSFKTD